MQIINLYRVIRQDGGVTVTPNKPDSYEKVMYRIVAELESKSEESELEDAVAALNLLGVEAE